MFAPASTPHLLAAAGVAAYVLVWVALCLRPRRDGSPAGSSVRGAGLILFATTIGGLGVLGPSGEAYAVGGWDRGLIVRVLGPLLALILAYAVLGGRLARLAHATGAMTPVELLAARFGGRRFPGLVVDLVLAGVCLALSVVQARVLVGALGYILPYEASGAALAIGLATGLPVVFTGLRGLLRAQLWQAIVVVFGLATAGAIALAVVPDSGALFQATENAAVPVGPGPPLGVWFAVAAVGTLFHPAVWLRLSAVAVGPTARVGGWWLGLGGIARLGAVLVGLAACQVYPRYAADAWMPRPSAVVDPNGHEFGRAYPTFAVENGSAAGALLLLVLVAATAGNLVATGHALAMMAAQDGYIGQLRPRASFRERERATGFFLLVLGLLAAGGYGYREHPGVRMAADFLAEGAMLAPALLLQILPLAVALVCPRVGRRWPLLLGFLAGVGVVLALSEPVHIVLASRSQELADRLRDWTETGPILALSLGINVILCVGMYGLSVAVWGFRRSAIVSGAV